MMIAGRSIDGVVADAVALYGEDCVFGVGTNGLANVVYSVSAAVCVVPGVICYNCVPKLAADEVGRAARINDKAGREVREVLASTEADVDEVLAWVIVLEVEAFQITVVPKVLGR
jgi:hypothetical protein